jgi:DNA polymerase III alpha subunit
VTSGYAELHCHTDFSFLDGASPADDLVERALELGLSGLAVTDHQGLYGAVRSSTAAREAGLHAVVGMEVELVDAAARPSRHRDAAASAGGGVPSRRCPSPGRGSRRRQ